MFEFPCIISLYYIKNQQDATLAVLFISSKDVQGRLPLQWQPTLDTLTGYISSRPTTCTSGC